MRSWMLALALAVAMLFPAATWAQCADGVCEIPAGRPVVAVVRAPVRVAVRIKPVRRAVALPVRIVQAKRARASCCD